MHPKEIDFKVIQPDAALTDFVSSFWMLTNQSDLEKSVVVLPDGWIDVTFSYYATDTLHIRLNGLATQPAEAIFPPKTTVFGVSLTLLAVEYLLRTSVAGLVNHSIQLPAGFWGMGDVSFHDFEHFCDTVTHTLRQRLKQPVDQRKLNLFRLVNSTNGAMTVRAMAEQVGQSSRQINRYFTRYIGLSLKAYGTILRFRSTFGQLKEGDLFPAAYFTDQAHFIKDVRKFASVVPKALSRNENDRFIQFSVG